MKAAAAIWLLIAALLSGCVAGKVDYVKPVPQQQIANVITIDKSLDDAWKYAVSEIGKRYFVINNIDRASGLINISYSGDPEAYADCGTIISEVEDANGKRRYEFPGSRGVQDYEFIAPPRGPLVRVRREMTLEGRVNMIFEADGPDRTKITANIRYVLTRRQTLQPLGVLIPQQVTDSVAFSSNEVASITPNAASGLFCTPSGKMEGDILASLR